MRLRSNELLINGVKVKFENRQLRDHYEHALKRLAEGLYEELKIKGPNDRQKTNFHKAVWFGIHWDQYKRTKKVPYDQKSPLYAAFRAARDYTAQTQPNDGE